MRLSGMQVIVVGGATAGAAAALLLARAGARVMLCEQDARPTAVGAGIALAPNGLAVLASLGLGPAIAAASTPLATPCIVDGAGRVLFEPPGPAQELRMLRRRDLQAVLLDALSAEPLIDTRFGSEVIDASPTGAVRIASGAGSATLGADLVIGADGVHSRVRARGGFAARVDGSGITYVRALVHGVPATGVEAWTAAGLFGSFPVRDGTYLYASAGSRQCRAAIEHQDIDAFRDAWARAYPAARPLLEAIVGWKELLVNEVRLVTCPCWVHGRLVLAGDAAHAMAPNLGQGANSALVDAAVLLDELRRAPDVPSALSAYQRRRQPAVARVAAVAAWLGRLAELTHPVTQVLRDRVLMPALQRVTRPTDLAAVLQEPVEHLLAIGRG